MTFSVLDGHSSIATFLSGMFLARDFIYTSRAYATMSVSVCLPVCLWRKCIVVTGCNGYQIPLHAGIEDVFATYWQRLTRIIGWDDAGISGGIGGGYGKIGNCSDITYFTYSESGPETVDGVIYLHCGLNHRCLHFYYRSCWRVFFSNLGRKCIISEEQFVLGLPASRPMLATAEPSCLHLCTTGKISTGKRCLFATAELLVEILIIGN